MSRGVRGQRRGVDFALVAYREEGIWQVEELDDDAAADLDGLAARAAPLPRRRRRRSAWSRSTRTSSCWSGCSAPTSGCCSPT